MLASKQNQTLRQLIDSIFHQQSLSFTLKHELNYEIDSSKLYSLNLHNLQYIKMMPSSSPWKFNPSINQTKQFPLYFAHPLADTISKVLTAFGNTQNQRIIYMGPRHTSSSKLLKAYSIHSRSQNEVIDSEIYGEDEINKYSYDPVEKQKYYPVRSSQYRLFVGANPTTKKSELWFDSNFQCGNLDLVVSLGNNEYDLYMRVDSNTKGHTCWFFFKVSNFLDRQKVQFNIVNFSRSQMLYDAGMKIFTYCSSSKEWVQDGQNIKFYPRHKCKYIDESSLEEWSSLYTLSFQYQFKIQDEFVYFAYCVPYSYSFLQLTLTQMEKKYIKIMDIDRSNLSTGGLSIPLITITNKNSNLLTLQSEAQSKKEVILIIGRVHPGQTQSSWILHGFLNYLCSPKAKQLRNKTIFKILPMVNVDGVVAGNFRTGLFGRDLNRSFNHPELLIEIGLIRSIATMFKPLMFLDFHGHSSKKNIFAYGPDYSIDHRCFLPSRLFCKLVSKCTNTFRYYGCSFKISASKKSTGRSIMLRHHLISYSFTIEASAFAYGSKKQETMMDRYEYTEAGSQICMGLDKFIKIALILPKRLQLEKQIEIQRLKQDKKLKNNKSATLQSEQPVLSTEDKRIFQQIISDERQPQKFDPDTYGAQDSDFQEDNDYTEKQLMRMLKDPSETPLFQNKKNHKRTNKKLLALSIKQSRKNKSLSSQKNMKLQLGSKFTQPQQPANMNRKFYNRNKLKELSPDLQRNQSESLHLNVQLFPPSDTANINKIHVKLPKKIFSDDSCIIIEDPLSKLKSLNQIGLDYTLNKARGQYEPLSGVKKMKEKDNIIKKRSKQKEKEKVPYNLCAPVPKKKEGVVEIKYSILPMLGRSGNMDKEESHSLLNEILENHERSISNRAAKHSKIFYH